MSRLSSLISSDSYRPYSAGQVIEKNEQLFLVCLAFLCAPQSLREAGPQQNSIKVGLVAEILFPNLFIRTQFVCSESSIPSRNLLVETVRRQFSKILAALIRLKHVDFFVFWCPMEPTKCIESDQHHIKPIQTRCITLPETNIAPENGWLEVGIQLSIWEGLFSGAM